MSRATHEQLLKVVKPCKEYDAYAKGGSSVVDMFGGDCCNCPAFHPLKGDVGMDWGVCFNPKSPRAGLLNFEHYGCEFYGEYCFTARSVVIQPIISIDDTVVRTTLGANNVPISFIKPGLIVYHDIRSKVRKLT